MSAHVLFLLSYDEVCIYWKYLKAKLRKEENELVSATTQLKLTATDGKKYKTKNQQLEFLLSY